MSDIEIDARMHAALARLTAAERECLSRRLRHQTAKEMALDLGISPHAVEKRLKMARAKLGLSSSLDAARLMVAAEGYQQTAARAADLASVPPGGQSWLHKPVVLGGIAMALFAATALVLSMQTAPAAVAPIESGGVAPLPQASAAAPANSPYDEVPGGKPGQVVERGIDELQFVPASPDRIRRFLAEQFARMDKDKSGYLVPSEAPPGSVMTDQPQPAGSPPRPFDPARMERTDGMKAREMWISFGDSNHDGRQSLAEYTAWLFPTYEKRGIPLIPADWKPAP